MKKYICLIIFVFLSSSVFAEQQFPKFIEMKDLFHAEVEYSSGEKAEMLAWWNIWAFILIGLNIFFRCLRKMWSGSVEPAFFIVMHFVPVGICAFFLGFQIFCNIFQFDWRILVAFIALFSASIWSGMIDFEFLHEEKENEYEFKNLKPKMSFLVLMTIFFFSQFVYF